MSVSEGRCVQSVCSGCTQWATGVSLLAESSCSIECIFLEKKPHRYFLNWESSSSILAVNFADSYAQCIFGRTHLDLLSLVLKFPSSQSLKWHFTRKCRLFICLLCSSLCLFLTELMWLKMTFPGNLWQTVSQPFYFFLIRGNVILFPVDFWFPFY